MRPEKSAGLKESFSFSSFAMLINGRKGPEDLSFISLCQAFVKNKELDSDQEIAYLYVFEKGWPVLVTFGYHVASGSFVLLSKEETESVESVRNAFASFFDVTPVTIAH